MGTGLLASPGAEDPPPTGVLSCWGEGFSLQQGQCGDPGVLVLPAAAETVAPPALEAHSSTPAGHLTFHGTEALTDPAKTLGERDMGVACPAVGARAWVPEGPWA